MTDTLFPDIVADLTKALNMAVTRVKEQREEMDGLEEEIERLKVIIHQKNEEIGGLKEEIKVLS